jgi:AcrR family transcriptional regulator
MPDPNESVGRHNCGFRFSVYNSGIPMTQFEPDLERLLEEHGIKSVSGTSRDGSDGRVANRLRNREHVIDTFIELVKEGKDGTLEQVIERSGVARRSIYRYFDDLSDLSMKVLRRVVAAAAVEAQLPNPGVGPLPERIATFAAMRLQTLAATHAFELLARNRAGANDDVQDGLAFITKLMRLQLNSQFEPELTEMDGEPRERLLDTIILLTSFEGYDLLVRRLGRPIDVVETTWNEALTALLDVA